MKPSRSSIPWHTVVEYVLAPPVVGAAAIAVGIRARDAVLPISVLAASSASKLLKRIVDAPRPPCSDERDQAFPSGHATTLAAFGASLLLLTRRRDVGVLAAAAVALVDIARVASCDHRPRDVLAGDALGVAIAAVAHRLWR